MCAVDPSELVFSRRSSSPGSGVFLAVEALVPIRGVEIMAAGLTFRYVSITKKGMNLRKIIDLREAQAEQERAALRETGERKERDRVEFLRLKINRLHTVMQDVVGPVFIEGATQLKASGYDARVTEQKTIHPLDIHSTILVELKLTLRRTHVEANYVLRYGCDAETFVMTAAEEINGGQVVLGDGYNMPLETLERGMVERHLEAFVDHALSDLSQRG